MTDPSTAPAAPLLSDLGSPDGEVVEVSLLLPGGLAAALEAAARGSGLTTGQMVRHLIRDFFSKFARPQAV